MNNKVSVFPYPGGKGRKSDWIVNKIPSHDTFVDVFGGSGSVIYNKPKSKNEIYNDINDDLVQFFEVMRNKPNELCDWVRNVPYSRSLYEDWVEDFYDGYRPNDPIERAGRFWTLRYMQFSGSFSSPNGFKTWAKQSPARTFDNARDAIEEIAERFRDVVIENRDYRDIFSTYDDESIDVVFYCDPPYVDGEGYYPGSFDHREFSSALMDVTNDWMVSYGQLPRELVARMIAETTKNGREFYVLNRDRRHRMCRVVSEAEENLICNFDPESRKQFVSKETSQMKLGEMG